MRNHRAVPRIRNVVLPLCLAAGIAIPALAQKSPAPAGEFRWPEGKKAALSLTFDDARGSQIDNGLPFFESQGVKVTFYVNPGAVKARQEGWKQAVRLGHEIGNHTVRHPCSDNFIWIRERKAALEDYSLSQMQRELLDANRQIRELLGVTPVTFAYPCGQKFIGRGKDVKSTVPLVARLFQAGRGYNDESLNAPLFGDLAQLSGPNMDNRDYTQVKTLVDLALAQGGWLVLAGHDIGDDVKPQMTRRAMLKELLEDVRRPGREVWVDTVQNISSYLRRDPKKQ